MKQLYRYTILVLSFVLFTVISLPLKGKAQAPLKVEVFLPSAKFLPKWGSMVSESVRQISEKMSGNIKVTVNQIDGEEDQYKFLIPLIEKQKAQVVIGYFSLGVLEAVMSKIRNGREILISPVFNKQIIKLSEKYKPNLYVIPESIDAILLTIDQSVRNFGPDDMQNLRNTLELKAQDAVKKAEYYQNKIRAKVIEGIADWKNKTKMGAQAEFVDFQKEKYSSDLFSYMIRLPGRKEKLPELLQGVASETTKILDKYVEYEKAKGLKIASVELGPFLASGVNGCSVLPCKKYCCDNYKDHNLDDCLNLMSCE